MAPSTYQKNKENANSGKYWFFKVVFAHLGIESLICSLAISDQKEGKCLFDEVQIVFDFRSQNYLFDFKNFNFIFVWASINQKNIIETYVKRK